MISAIKDLFVLLEWYLAQACPFFPQFTWGAVIFGLVLISLIMTLFYKSMS